ncbi:MAG: ABC transporter ATP-binding protein [Caldilineae bacterium]|nr:MAG: ABC transporter ATP-binding protein [Caldilineae bacterium]
MTSPLLEIHNLRKSFAPGTPAVDGVTFAVQAGEIVCLLGPSGCGKTTLLRMIAGLETPDEGEVRFAGRSVANIPPHRRDFGMMFQDFALFPHKNVFENVAFGLQMRGDSPEEVRRRVAEMLALVDLQGLEERDVSRLSGGEQQRVALARSLAPGPRLLMLDEPLGSLDRALRERLMLDLRRILKRVGVTAIYVTHDQTEAFAVADRVAVMNAGRIEQLDTPQRIFAQPATPFVARFLGFHNLLPATTGADGTVVTPVGTLQTASPLPAAGTAVTVLLRPEAQAGDAEHNRIEGRITAIAFRGKYYQLWLEANGQSLMFELPAVGNWQVGDRVRLSLPPRGVMLI